MKALQRLVIPLWTLVPAIIASVTLARNSSGLPPDLLFKEVVSSIAMKEKWDPESVRVSKFASGSVRLARSRKFELQVRTGKSTALVFTFPEELDGGTWRKPRRRGTEKRWRRLDKPLRWPRPKLNSFELAGPMELKVVGDNRFSILLPANNTHANLKRILVGKGIRIMVKGAEEVTLSDSSASEINNFWFGAPSLCSSLLSISIAGPASLVALQNHNRNSYIGTSFKSPENLELLPDKCYYRSSNMGIPPAIYSILSLTNMPESLLNAILGGGSLVRHAIKARVAAFTLARFKVEVEREIRYGDRVWSETPEWKSKPTVEREWFEILARAGPRTALKPVFQRRLMRGSLVRDSMLLGSLLPNVSFSQLHSIVRPPQLFTLDVKW